RYLNNKCNLYSLSHPFQVVLGVAFLTTGGLFRKRSRRDNKSTENTLYIYINTQTLKHVFLGSLSRMLK
ncbi:MAG: hypothetical protein PV340_02855, partial [Wolbachia sp.]|nr:hypothetical protein [Wolbachia sp.]